MSAELIYTSAPRGLRAGSQGLCIVAMTRSLPSSLTEKLESLSAYRPLVPTPGAASDRNPILHAHYRLKVGGKTYHVLSRVCTAGLDYSQRTNQLAHHVVLEGRELSRGGPAWLILQDGFMKTTWDGEVGYLPERVAPRGEEPLAPCEAWQSATGDAGWAGVLAEAYLKDPSKPAYLIFEPDQDPLPLIAEALALLPVENRWNVTFSTYFTALNSDVSCVWRCVARSSPEARTATRQTDALIIILDGNMPPAAGGALVECARTGILPAQQIVPIADLLPGMSSAAEKNRSGKAMRPRRAGRHNDDDVVTEDNTGVNNMPAPPPSPVLESQTPHGLRTRLAYFEAAVAAGFVLLLLIVGMGGYFLYSQITHLRTELKSELDEKESKRKDEFISLKKTVTDQQARIDAQEKLLTKQQEDLRKLLPLEHRLTALIAAQQKEIKKLQDNLPK